MSVLKSQKYPVQEDYAGGAFVFDVPANAESIAIFLQTVAANPAEISGVELDGTDAALKGAVIAGNKNGYTTSERVFVAHGVAAGDVTIQPEGDFSSTPWLSCIVVALSDDSVGVAVSTSINASSLNNQARTHSVATQNDSATLLTFAALNADSSVIAALNNDHKAIESLVSEFHAGAVYSALAPARGTYTSGAKFTNTSNREGGLITVEFYGAPTTDSDVEIGEGADTFALLSNIKIDVIEKGMIDITFNTTGSDGVAYLLLAESIDALDKQNIIDGVGANGQPVEHNLYKLHSVTASGVQTVRVNLLEAKQYFAAVVHNNSNVLRSEVIEAVQKEFVLTGEVLSLKLDGDRYIATIKVDQ